MPGNVCKSLISFKGNEGILEKKKKKRKAVSFTCVIQKCQLKNGSFWNENDIAKNFYNLLY